jgi:hypothetical protein
LLTGLPNTYAHAAVPEDRFLVKRRHVAAACRDQLDEWQPRFQHQIQQARLSPDGLRLLTACGLAALDEQGFLQLPSVWRAYHWCLPGLPKEPDYNPDVLVEHRRGLTAGPLPFLSESPDAAARPRFGFVEPLLKLHLIETVLANPAWNERHQIVTQRKNDLDHAAIEFLVHWMESLADLRPGG